MHEDKYVPANTNGGWGVAALVWAIVIALIVWVTYVHNKGYRHFTDVRARPHGEPTVPAAPSR